MKPEYPEDGVHHNKAGYLIMEKIAEPIIKKVVGKNYLYPLNPRTVYEMLC
jgi:hypothetical protein